MRTPLLIVRHASSELDGPARCAFCGGEIRGPYYWSLETSTQRLPGVYGSSRCAEKDANAKGYNATIFNPRKLRGS